jgi:hypothetical protein
VRVGVGRVPVTLSGPPFRDTGVLRRDVAVGEIRPLVAPRNPGRVAFTGASWPFPERILGSYP